MTAGDEVSEETLLMAARVRERAASMPTAADLAGVAAEAFAQPRGNMSPAEIREVFTEAVAKAQRVSYLLGVLAGQLGEPAGEP